jgi:hypothetical protein
MSTAELNKLKLDLIAWINQVTDINLISFLEGLRNSQSKTDWWEELSKEQKAVVMKGLEDAEKGSLISSSEFWKRLRDA